MQSQFARWFVGQQPEAVRTLLALLRTTPFSAFVFSGYPLEVRRAQSLGPGILANIDVVVVGLNVRDRHRGTGMLGSSNQGLHFPTARYRLSDFAGLPHSEVIIHRDGAITVSGFLRLFPFETE